MADQDPSALRSDLPISGISLSKPENIADCSCLSQFFSLRTSINYSCYRCVEDNTLSSSGCKFKAGKKKGHLQMIQKKFGVGKREAHRGMRRAVQHGFVCCFSVVCCICAVCLSLSIKGVLLFCKAADTGTGPQALS